LKQNFPNFANPFTTGHLAVPLLFDRQKGFLVYVKPPTQAALNIVIKDLSVERVW
jgi:hypothetical protein